ncbi:helix-turn-helix domain-containing protein [Candidatus Woesearchaeota archaeon]|nr:helix-turn-helix domain-containing protein [Candidatus Woesearchaeota archaeon]
MKSYKFRLYPNKKQENKLNNILNLAKFTYNKQFEGFACR